MDKQQIVYLELVSDFAFPNSENNFLLPFFSSLKWGWLT